MACGGVMLCCAREIYDVRIFNGYEEYGKAPLPGRFYSLHGGFLLRMS